MFIKIDEQETSEGKIKDSNMLDTWFIINLT